MFKKGDIIMHSKAGVCRVAAIKRNVSPKDPRARYYELETIFNDGTTILTPVDNDKIFLRPLYSKEELESIIKQIPYFDTQWEDNQKLRKLEAEKILASGDTVALLELVSTLYIKAKEKREEGKLLNIADQKNLDQANHLLYEEFAYVFEIEIDQVEARIDEMIEEELKSAAR